MEAKPKKRFAVLASGYGSTAESLFQHFEGRADIEAVLLLSNNPKARALSVAERYGVPTATLTNAQAADPAVLSATLAAAKPDLVVLAGYLRLIPSAVVREYAGRMINVHPSLLPKFGGPGMYGARVHEAVLAAGEKRSGLTVHYVTEAYDEGAPILQAYVDIQPGWTAEDLAHAVQELHFLYFPKAVEGVTLNTF